jgi:hypothetical protein
MYVIYLLLVHVHVGDMNKMSDDVRFLTIVKFN